MFGETCGQCSSTEVESDLSQSCPFCTECGSVSEHKFSSPLKTNFENISLWKRFALTLLLKGESPRRALHAMKECLRIDKLDPMPAMLAAKLLVQDIDDPEEALKLADQAIQRCLNLDSALQTITDNNTAINSNGTPTKSLLDSNVVATATTSNSRSSSRNSNNNIIEAKYHKNTSSMLSKSYLLASVINAHSFEREPESIRQFKNSYLQASINFLDLALKANPDNHLAYFHKAIHKAHQRSYPAAIDNVRQALQLNQCHVPSIHLLLLCLSALKLYEDALMLCESSLYEFQDDLMLLYIKCNLEQCVGETTNFKAALGTAQHILKCIRRSTRQPTKIDNKDADNCNNNKNQSSQTNNLFSDDFKDARKRENEFNGELTIWLLVAEIFIKMGLLNDAEQCVHQASSHITGALSHQIMYVRGLISKASNNLSDAKNYFQSAVALSPRHAFSLQQLAHVHYLLGNPSTAEKFLKDSLDIDSSCHRTWYYLSLVLLDTNQAEKASDCVMKALNLESTSPVIPLSTIKRLTFY